MNQFREIDDLAPVISQFQTGDVALLVQRDIAT
jgi:hypothetical protein